MTVGGPVAITGIGAVTPLGDVGEMWPGMLAGESGLGPAPAALRDAGCEVVGAIEAFDATRYMDRHAARRMGRFSQFSVAACRMALADAGLDVEGGEDVGLVVHTGAGGLLEAEAATRAAIHRPDRVSPFFTPVYGANMAACQPSLELGIRGPVLGGVGACAAGAQAVADGLRLVQRGDARVVLAGATDAGLSPLLLGSLANAGALAPAGHDPASASRPFDRARAGMVAAEGAAVVVLEPAEQARARGAGVLALVSGGGSAGDAHNLAAPHPQGRGAELAMRRALADAAVQPSAVDALVAHATATPLGDVAEVRAVKAVFGASPRLAVTAPKGAIGHGLGAAGAFAVVVAALSLRDGVLAPTRNLSDPDPECQLDHVVDRPRRAALGKVLVNASGFGGQNAAVLLSRDQP